MTVLNGYYRGLLARWNAADRHRPPDRPKPEPAYQTPESTEQAFWFVVKNRDRDYLARWLDDRPQDREYLLDLLRKQEPAHG